MLLVHFLTTLSGVATPRGLRLSPWDILSIAYSIQKVKYFFLFFLKFCERASEVRTVVMPKLPGPVLPSLSSYTHIITGIKAFVNRFLKKNKSCAILKLKHNKLKIQIRKVNCIHNSSKNCQLCTQFEKRPRTVVRQLSELCLKAQRAFSTSRMLSTL